MTMQLIIHRPIRDWLLPAENCFDGVVTHTFAAPVHFALLFATTGSWAAGPRIAGAAALALARINADKGLLPGRVLEYSSADSGCSAKQGLKAIGELQARGQAQGQKISAVIGPGCSSACEVTSHLSGGQNIPQISWGWSDPFLSPFSCFEYLGHLVVLQHIASSV